MVIGSELFIQVTHTWLESVKCILPVWKAMPCSFLICFLIAA